MSPPTLQAAPPTEDVSQGAAFPDHAEALADFALSRVVVRRDVYGAYQSDGGQFTEKAPVTRALLIRHFRGEITIGLHSISTDGRCLTVAWDIDAHGVAADRAANWRCASRVTQLCADLGLTALIFDSDGKGGFHVRVFFKKPVAAAVAYWLCERVKVALEAEGFTVPEAFPKQGELTLDRPYGSWLRLFGRHHKRPHWTRIYDPNSVAMMEGKAAIVRLLAVKADDARKLLEAYKEDIDDAPPWEKKAPPPSSTKRDSRAVGGNGRESTPDEAEVRSALNALPAHHCEAYGGSRADCGWLGVGMALHDWNDGAAGLALFHEFSSRSLKYDPAVVDDKWSTFSVGGGLTIKTVFKAANDSGWRWIQPARSVESKQTSGESTVGVKSDPTPRDKTFSNFTTTWSGEGENRKPTHHPLRTDALARSLVELIPGWPKRVGELLFRRSPDFTPVYLDSATRFFAWIDSHAQVEWTKGARFIPQERFYEHLRMNAEQYDSIEPLPHWPARPGVYYMHAPVPRPTGMLSALLDFFCPATAVDRELIKAFLITLFWGGQPGARPAFLVTGPDEDAEQGRGIGKSRLPAILAEELAGGSIDVAPTEQIPEVKTRMLSDAGRLARVALLDNIKTLRLSWADLEGLITTSTISGRMLYRGEGQRPNTIVWVITLNGASLSKDMAQRVIPIKLGRPKFDGTWESSVREFIRQNRWEIIAELGEILQSRVDPGESKTRWAAWEREVLSKVDAPAACRAVILERQGLVDDDNEERDVVESYFAERLTERGHDPLRDAVFIPFIKVAEWLSVATGTRYPTNRASTYLCGLGIPQLKKSRTPKVKGWEWWGVEADPMDELAKLKDCPFPVGPGGPRET